MIRAVVFDLDGVLVDSKGAWFDTMNALREQDGLSPISHQAFDAAWERVVAHARAAGLIVIGDVALFQLQLILGPLIPKPFRFLLIAAINAHHLALVLQKRFCYRSADTSGRAGNDCGFACEFCHGKLPD